VITVSIGGASFPLERVSEGWINQMIAEARRLNQSLCIRVEVQEPSAHLILSTPGCSGGAGGGRQPNPTERRILDEWNRRNLNSNEFGPGQLQAFLKELARLT
jgi:hypothetical protein